MTALAPPVVTGPPSPAASGGRSGSVAWMALPALAMFVGFGVIPLFGVLWGWLFLGETLPASALAGGALIVAGTVLVTRG